MEQSKKQRRKVYFRTGIVLLFAGVLVVVWLGFSNNGKKTAGENDKEKSQMERIHHFDELAEQVLVKKDIIYSKQFDNSKLDVYMPKAGYGTPKPTIFWAHGGAFIGGDKKSTADYSTMLASQGYVVINMNYSLAPEYEYPTPILQVGDAYLYIAANQKQFDVDLDRLAFGGDSAGGQIIGQFVNIQVDRDYADLIDIKPVIKDADTIKSVIFFSALLDINQYDENGSDYANEFFDQSAQSYFGLKQWKYSDVVNNANIISNVSEKFPPTYMTDGNTFSFQTQAEELHDILDNEQVPVESTFFPVEQAELRHQYQFHFSRQEAVENYNQVSTFLAKYLNH